MPVHEHREASRLIEVKFCLVVTSDSILKGSKKDEVTGLVRSYLDSVGLRLVQNTIVPNDCRKIAEVVKEYSRKCDIVVVTGGTGIGDKDVSVEAVKGLCSKEMPGFGELFRYLTYLNHGSAAIMSRAMACRVNYSVVFVTPGSKDAVNLALTKLIVPESRHIAYELRRK